MRAANRRQTPTQVGLQQYRIFRPVVDQAPDVPNSVTRREEAWAQAHAAQAEEEWAAAAALKERAQSMGLSLGEVNEIDSMLQIKEQRLDVEHQRACLHI
jgi:hypothetical protein